MSKLIVAKDNWQTKVLLATHDRWGKPSQLGIILRAILHRQGAYRPALGDVALIDANGIVRCVAWLELEVRNYAEAEVGHITTLRDDLRRLADMIHLSDTERLALFEELRKWIGKDYRSNSQLDEVLTDDKS